MIRATVGESIPVTGKLTKNSVDEDLTPWNIKAALRKSVDGEVIKQYTVTKNGTAFSLSADFVGVTPGEYVLSIRFALPNGPIRTITDKVIVKKDLNW